MRSTQTLEQRRVAAVESLVIAWATCRVAADQVADHRKSPAGATVAPALLRHADEQTVVGLAAVFSAIRDGGLDPAGFGRWSVLAAPRYFGRSAFERAFPPFQAEGAWGISPHLIPAHSLHSISGTISQAIGAHGPNLGVGGTPGGELEGLLFASTLLLEGNSDGVWLILSGRLDQRDGSSEPGDYEALALGLTLSTPGSPGVRIRVQPGEARVLGASETSGKLLEGWFGPGTLRVDGPSAIPRPHFRRAGRPGGLS